MAEVPIIDVGSLRGGGDDAARARTTAQLDAACRDTGFFYIVGHGVQRPLLDRLDALAREFFALDEETKARIAMAHGGQAWRGWFPLDGELTSGVPDHKEGIYFGSELGPDHPRVRAGVPLHGPNLFPERPAALRETVLEFLDEMTALAHDVAAGLALGLGLEADWFASHLTADPTLLFRIFHYPPRPAADDGWGVAEHTDYGLLTILLQDEHGGLQVRAADGWRDAPPVPGSFVCNLGDMLERMTGGRYRSTPHRVRNTSDVSRLSFPFFFDPSWDAQVVPVPGCEELVVDGAHDRWDQASVHDYEGTYGDYLLGKVAKVFPDLGGAVLDS